MTTSPPKRTHIAMLTAAVCGSLACAAPRAVAQSPAPPAAAATGGTLYSWPGALLGELSRFRGTLPDVPAGRTVQIERLTPDRGWVPETTAVAGRGGAYLARWRPKALGRFVVRAVAGGQAAVAAAAPPTTQVTVYRPARATWYGPGLYGRRTACGQVLSHALLGVAHRRLPCGTAVELYLGGRSITVPVVDRGPFANGALYDLTSATAERLGLTVTRTIGASPQRGTIMPPQPAAAPVGSATGGVTHMP
jgi:rare lipoprotein A